MVESIVLATRDGRETIATSISMIAPAHRVETGERALMELMDTPVTAPTILGVSTVRLTNQVRANSKEKSRFFLK